MKMKKALLLVVCAALLVAASVMGTVAYLQDSTDAVVNTFTVGEVQITLTETFNTDTDNDNTNDAWSAKLIPGVEYAKDPVVTVLADSEDCWLFVEIVETNNPASYLTYTYNLEGWTALPGETGVYYREVAQSDVDQSWDLLVDNKVTVKTGIVNPDAAAGTNEVNMPTEANAPSISFTAYAIQKEGFTSAAAAWAQVS
ncbi:MAG: hypothetical protein IJD81_07085 [Oscillospiraceae bacterium]|nr:hypothetical protein [Oscillospiraceae bacterium]